VNAARIIDHFLGTATLTCSIAAALCWVAPALDDAASSTEAHAGRALTLYIERAADIEACRRLHGPDASAVHLPDGQHRCTDSRGAPMSRRSGVVLVNGERP
jgi:hypothetical protein